jgi:hypothetical protein
MSTTQPLGPVMLDVAALLLDDADRERLLHPLTGGVILFKRNFASDRRQLRKSRHRNGHVVTNPGRFNDDLVRMARNQLSAKVGDHAASL